MIRHCVFIRYKDSISLAKRRSLFDAIQALQSHLPGMMTVQSGQNVSPEAGIDKGFSDGFMVDFLSSEARDTYLDDEAHKAVGAQLVAAAEGGVEGILVFDFELTDDH